MSSTSDTKTRRCVLCWTPRPETPSLNLHWVVREATSLTGADLSVDVCPSCRAGHRKNDPEHLVSDCSGAYKGPDQWTAKCTEVDCGETFSCWQQECVEAWAEGHFDDSCECSNCLEGHHDARVTPPSKAKEGTA